MVKIVEMDQIITLDKQLEEKLAPLSSSIKST
jgi:hypothetical protein